MYDKVHKLSRSLDFGLLDQTVCQKTYPFLLGLYLELIIEELYYEVGPNHKTHSWEKVKNALIRKPKRKSYYFLPKKWKE